MSESTGNRVTLDADRSGESERALRQLEGQLAQAVVQGDTEFVRRVFADDFAYTGVRAELKGKADILAELGAGTLQFDVLRFEDVRVRVYAEAAVATGCAVVRGQSPQGPITGDFRYTRVYIRQEGAWRLVAFQGTPIAAH